MGMFETRIYRLPGDFFCFGFGQEFGLNVLFGEFWVPRGVFILKRITGWKEIKER